MSATRTHLSDTDADEEAPAWAKCLTNAFQSHQASMNTKLEEINSAIKTLSKDFNAVKHRVTSAEQHMSTLEDDFGKENALVKELSKKVSSLCQLVDDLEEEQHQNNRP